MVEEIDVALPPPKKSIHKAMFDLANNSKKSSKAYCISLSMQEIINFANTQPWQSYGKTSPVVI